MIKKIERTFDLINNKGEAYPLSRYDAFSGFFGNVQGLGVEHEAAYQKLGNVYELLQDNVNQGEIAGVIFFQSQYPYQEYIRFVRFCQETPLKLRYVTPAGEYYRDGIVSKIEKNENDNPSRAKVIFTASSLWYKFIEKSSDTSVLTIESDSVYECGCHVMFTPDNNIASSYLQWYQLIDDNSTYITGRIYLTSLTTTQILHIRSDTNPYQIKRNTTDLYSNSDFSTKRFFFICPGSNQLVFQTNGSVRLEVKLLYETV